MIHNHHFQYLVTPQIESTMLLTSLELLGHYIQIWKIIQIDPHFCSQLVIFKKHNYLLAVYQAYNIKKVNLGESYRLEA